LLRLTVLFGYALVANAWFANALAVLPVLTIQALFVYQTESLEDRESRDSSLHPLFASSGIPREVLD
jgi:hypothetical protein